MPNEVKKPRVEVLSVRAIEKGNLKGFATVKIGPLTLHDFRIIQQPLQRAYVSPPQFEYLDSENRRKFKPVAQYPETWRQAISEAILAAWEAEYGSLEVAA